MENCPCLQFITNDIPCILPASGIQDIMPLRTFQKPYVKYDWFLGTLPYMQNEIPIIQLNIQQQDDKNLFKEKLAKIMVIHNVAPNPAEPYFGLVVANIPKMISVMPDELYYVTENESIHPLVRGKEAQGYIMNFEAINEMLSKLKNDNMKAPQ